LDAFWANAATMQARAAPKPIRLASKSVRCRSLQERVLARPGFVGTMAFTLPEALWLAEHGAQDILVAYPSVDRAALRALAALPADRPETRVSVRVDSVEHLDVIDAAIGRSPSGQRTAPIRLCLELDAGFPLPRGRGRVGAKRSP